MRWLDGITESMHKSSGVGDEQGSLVCCSPWGLRESGTTDLLNWTDSLYRKCRKNIYCSLCTGSKKKKKNWFSSLPQSYHFLYFKRIFMNTCIKIYLMYFNLLQFLLLIKLLYFFPIGNLFKLTSESFWYNPSSLWNLPCLHDKMSQYHLLNFLLSTQNQPFSKDTLLLVLWNGISRPQMNSSCAYCYRVSHCFYTFLEHKDKKCVFLKDKVYCEFILFIVNSKSY